MITVSSNNATRAMLKLLHDRNDLPAMHAELRGLGLGTLQVNDTNPGTGGNWQPGSIHMTALDTARLLWLIEGGSGTLWLRPDGRPVLASLLSSSSRTFLKGLLDDQAFHEALSTGSLCGKANVRPGIPALVPARWTNPDGTETAGGFPYGQDVRPCNAAAEVVFGHKTGLDVQLRVQCRDRAVAAGQARTPLRDLVHLEPRLPIHRRRIRHPFVLPLLRPGRRDLLHATHPGHGKAAR